ncbi:TonB-dependent receptor [Maricaulis sp.]|uniref:TonB-dependent receptor n=1 Tax=Maricaulis sp. TaxID=1486257 RepID=UPI00262C95EF|nr:TonB-dependent receptor [Maricaulis sp.]
MNKGTGPRLRAYLLAGVAAGLLCAGSAAGQQEAATAGEGVTAVETIVVTARRREESLIEVPVAMTVQSAEALDLSGAADITALQRDTPNLTLQPARATNSTITAFIRGIGQQDPLWGFEPGIGLYIDDVYVARPQGAILDILDVERVEVLRGPQGTLYGRNTIGGAIKFVTARLDHEPAFAIRTNLGEYNQRDLIVSGSAPLSGTLRAGGALGIYRRDGYGTNLWTGADIGNRESLSARVTVEFEPAPDWFFRLTADRVDDDSNANPGHRELPVPAAFGVPPFTTLFGIDIPAGAFPVTADAYDSWAGVDETNEVITQGVALTGEWTISDHLTFKTVTAWRDGETHGEGIDFDGTPEPVLDILAPETVYDDDQFSQEFQLLFDHDRWRGVAGVYYLDAYASGGYDTVLAIGAAAVPGAPTPNFTQGTSGHVDTTSLALFGEFDIDLADRWTLTLGGRWTRDEKTGTVFKANYFGLGSPVSGTPNTPFQVLTDYTAGRTFEEFTPRLGVSYRISDTLNAYLSYGRGFKSGGFDMRGDATATPATMEGYDPETVDSVELGLKGYLFGDRVRFAAAVFNASYDGQQVTSQQVNSVGTGLVSFIDNVGSSTIRGAELETQARLGGGFSLDLALGYVDAAFEEYLAYVPNDAPPPAFVLADVSAMRQFQNTPDWTGSLALNHHADGVMNGALDLRAALSWRGDSSMFETPAPEIDQEAYSLLDISAVWTSNTGRWRAGLHGRNLGDERYRTGGYYFPGLAYGDSVIGFYGPPRTVFASLEYRY